MRHLRIQILGPLAAWDVTDDGIWHPLDVSEGGWVLPGLLAAVIFKPDEKNGNKLAIWLWDATEISDASNEADPKWRSAWRRARKALGPHNDALPKGSDYYIAGRDDTHGPRRVYIDWDDVQRYQKAEKYEEALSLISGLPLPTFAEYDPQIGDLVADVQAKVTATIKTLLRAAKQPVPSKLSWVQLEKFAPMRPTEWIPRPTPPETTAIEPAASPAPAEPRWAPRPPTLFGAFSEAQLFESCHEGQARLGREQDEAASEGRDVWWGSCLWLGKYLALWHKTLDTPCGEIAFTYIDDVYDAARFGVDGEDAPKDKATLIEAPKQLGDNDNKQVICGRTNWGLAHIWAKNHADTLFKHPSNLSVFGVRGRPVYPNILGVHTLVQTNDKFLLFALRSPEVDFHELTWSASFEESVSVGPREFTGPVTGDKTILDPIQGGLCEEWGIEEDALLDSSCLAIGREWVREDDARGSRLNLSPTILAACRLTLSLDEVWESLDEVARIRDRDEHRSWAGCRFADRDALLRFVGAANGRTSNVNLLQDLCAESEARVEMQLYPGGAVHHIRDRGLMPTSAARLVLGSAWLAYRESIDKNVT